MASIESTTAGKLLQDFIKGYDDDPFGEQGLVIVKQLLDLAFPNLPLKEIISSKELLELLNVAGAEYSFRKQPLFMAFTSFLIEKNLLNSSEFRMICQNHINVKSNLLFSSGNITLSFKILKQKEMCLKIHSSFPLL